jgi:glycosyltransferase involved in cell wall biosynthesis
VRLLFLGRLSSEDKADFAALFRCVRMLAERGVDCALVTAGGGTRQDAEALRALSVAYAIGDRVDIRVGVNDEDKTLLLSGSDIFVSPSNTISESFGLSLVEAMGHSLPVVCSDWSGYREVIAHGIQGYLIPVCWDSGSEGAWETAYILGQADSMAKRVALDAVRLADWIEYLVCHPDERVRMGTAGRVRAESVYSEARERRDIASLFTEARRASCQSCSGSDGGSDKITRAFGDYGTHRFPEDVICGQVAIDELPWALAAGVLDEDGALDICERMLKGEEVCEMLTDAVFALIRGGILPIHTR